MSLKTNFRPSPKNLTSCKNVSMNVMCPQCPDRPQLVQSVLRPGPHSVQSVLTPVPTQSRDHTPVADKPLNSTHTTPWKTEWSVVTLETLETLEKRETPHLRETDAVEPMPSLKGRYQNN